MSGRYSASRVLSHRMNADPALEWFLQDAKRLGLTPAEYERRFSIILTDDGDRPSPAAARVRRHEVPAGTVTDDDMGLARHKEKRRVVTRRQSSAMAGIRAR